MQYEPLIQRLLQQRQLTDPQQAHRFLNPDYDDLTPLSAYDGLDACAQRVRQAIDMRQTVVIYGDYDCDGICSIAILYLFLKEAGVDAHYFIPNRHKHGYGLRVETLEYIAEQWLPDLVITVDCGITAVQEVEYARDVLGFDVIVTDHHTPPETLPDCLIFNPKLTCKAGAFRELCGAGVVLRLVEALSSAEQAKQYLDIAAIATVADVVPLVEDNRAIASLGIRELNRTKRKGLEMLIRGCVKSGVNAYEIGFQIAPRINAVGRMGDATNVVSLFTETDFFLLKCLIEEIERSNETRQQHTNDLTKDCMERLVGFDFASSSCIVLSHPYWEDGVLGIAAARLVGEFHRPVILLTRQDGVWKGSGRSVEGIDLYACVNDCKAYLTRFGGHAMACGVSLAEKDLQDFIAALDAACKRRYPDFVFRASSHAVAVDAEELNLTVCKQLRLLEPFGEGNREPYFELTLGGTEFVPIGDGAHIKARLGESTELIGFSMSNWRSVLQAPTEKRVTLSMRYSEFRNIETASCYIKRIECPQAEEREDLRQYVAWSMARQTRPYAGVSYERALDMAQDATRTVCYLVHTPQAARKLCDDLSARGCAYILDYELPSDADPRLRIVYRPDRNCDLRYYDAIVLLERPLSDGCPATIGMCANAALYCTENGAALDAASAALPTYERLGRLFLTLKSVLRTTVARDLYTVYLAMCKLGEIGWNEFAIAFYIFVDLGIVIYRNNAIMIQETVRTRLDASALYGRLREHAIG